MFGLIAMATAYVIAKKLDDSQIIESQKERIKIDTNNTKNIKQ